MEEPHERHKRPRCRKCSAGRQGIQHTPASQNGSCPPSPLQPGGLRAHWGLCVGVSFNLHPCLLNTVDSFAWLIGRYLAVLVRTPDGFDNRACPKAKIAAILQVLL